MTKVHVFGPRWIQRWVQVGVSPLSYHNHNKHPTALKNEGCPGIFGLSLIELTPEVGGFFVCGGVAPKFRACRFILDGLGCGKAHHSKERGGGVMSHQKTGTATTISRPPQLITN